MKFLVVVLAILLAGCNTVKGIREDVSKPLVFVGKVGEKIKGDKTVEEDKK